MGEKSLTYPLSQDLLNHQYNVQFGCMIRCIAGELHRGRTEVFDFRDDERRNLSNHLIPRQFMSRISSHVQASNDGVDGIYTISRTLQRPLLSASGRQHGRRGRSGVRTGSHASHRENHTPVNRRQAGRTVGIDSH